MLADPFLVFAKCFSTWLRIQIVMAVGIVWLIILMSLSAWESISVGGSFSSAKLASGASYSNWDSQVCSAVPYVYLAPFEFSYSSVNGTSSSIDSSCAWPTENTAFRLTITVVGMVQLGLMFIKTPFSLIARMIFVTYALLFFAVFVLDANAANTGQQACSSSFKNTQLHTDLTANGISVKCNSGNFAAVIVIDLIVCFIFFLLHTAWGLCTNTYEEKKGKGTKKAIEKTGLV